jgi:hypothetical protein
MDAHLVFDEIQLGEHAHVLTPLAITAHPSHDQCPCTPKEHAEYEKCANGFSYLEGIGAGLYATQMCPDIQHAMGILAKFRANPGNAHLEAFKHLIHYLNATAHFRLTGKENGL